MDEMFASQEETAVGDFAHIRIAALCPEAAHNTL